MNPLTVRAENVGRYAEFELEIPTGTVAVVGPNGSGKSTLLRCLELALFADGSRDLADVLGPHSDRLEIELEFEHDGSRFRVRRRYRRSASGTGTAHVDFEKHVFSGANGPSDAPGGWDSLNRETAKETQALICKTLGLSRQTFNASAFLAQGQGGMFPELPPSDRRAILGEILDPDGLWPRLADRARSDAKALEQTLAVAAARIMQLEQAGSLTDAEDSLQARQLTQLAASEAFDEAQDDLEEAQKRLAGNEAAAERVRAASATVAHAREKRDQAQTAAAAAQTAAEALPGRLTDLQTAEARAAELPELEKLLDEERRKTAEHTAKLAQHRAHLADAKRHTDDTNRLQADLDQLRREHDQAAATKTADLVRQTCRECGQPLHTEAARETALKNRLEQLAATIVDKAAQHAEAQELARAASVAALDTQVGPEPPKIGETEQRILVVRAAAAALPERRHAVETMTAQAASRETHEQLLRASQETLQAAETALADASEGVLDQAALERAVAAAKTQLAERRRGLDFAAAEAARAEQAVEQLKAAAAELEQLRSENQAHLDRLDVLRLAERAYGRDGIPVLIAENVAIPQIEAEANRLLERLPTDDGSVMRVELRTQRENRDGSLREALDIMVEHDGRVGEYLTFSGGERTRLSIALRFALAKLLAGRLGADVRVLVIDEPDALDASGMEHLAGILRDAAGSFEKILVVSHNPLLASAFDESIEIVKAGGVSRVAGTREAVPA